MYGLVFIMASICVCIGFSVALFIERRNRRLMSTAAGAAHPDEATDALNSKFELSLVQELLNSLQELTVDVASNVDHHSSRVAKISQTFDLNTVNDPKIVLKVAKQLIDANKELQHDLMKARDDIHIQKRLTQSYMNQACTDSLTTLPNRRAFEQELYRCREQWEQQKIPLTLILIDVDHFKRFNDYHGHQAGDVVLQDVASILEKTVGVMEIVCRYGGEEFGAILPGSTLEQGKICAERMRNAIADNTLNFDQSELRVTISTGLAQILEDEETADLVKRADKALYAAKNAGRNFTFFHDGETTRGVNAIPAEVPCAPLRKEDLTQGTQIRARERMLENSCRIPERQCVVDANGCRERESTLLQR